MKLKKLTLQNVKNIKSKTIEFDDTSSNILAIVGENGTGKTTILKSIINNLQVLSPIYGGQMFDSKDVNPDEEFLQIGATYVFNNEELAQFNTGEKDTHLLEKEFNLDILIYKDTGTIAFLIRKEENYKEIFAHLRRVIYSKNFIGANVFYFDPFRYLPKEELEGPNSMDLPLNPREGTLNPSVNGNEINKKYLFIKQWLINLDFKRLKNPSDENNYIFEKVTKSFNSIFSPFNFEKITDTGEILFRDNNEFIDIDRLSEGFKNIFIIVGDILFRMNLADPDNPKFFESEAIVMIDEIDCHIHPKWQVKILDYLQNMFPNAQFIITTHSPFIISKLDKNQLLKLGDI